MAANLHSRIATRIVARLGEVKAREFAPLRRGFAKLPWPSFIAPDRPLRMDVTTHHCRLYHTGALADTVRLAIEDRVGKLAVPAPAGEDSEESVLPQTRILVRGQDDVFTVSVDSSGALLHQRGWRLEAGRAPLRETLAAGILSLAGYDPSSPLVDPMCGSGTFAIEAAAMARRIAPGLGRDFALVHWPVVESGRWQKVLAAAAEGRREGAPSSVVASDRDPEAVAMAKRNAARAGVEGDIRFAVAELGSCEVPTSPGLVILNPPYGRRLGWRQQVLRLGKDIGRTLASRFAGGWRAAVLCPDEAFVSAVAAGLRSKPAATHPLRNGGLRVTLAIWSIP
jgi:putative N6-adenine-specific DNA methylase